MAIRLQPVGVQVLYRGEENPSIENDYHKKEYELLNLIDERWQVAYDEAEKIHPTMRMGLNAVKPVFSTYLSEDTIDTVQEFLEQVFSDNDAHSGLLEWEKVVWRTFSIEDEVSRHYDFDAHFGDPNTGNEAKIKMSMVYILEEFLKLKMENHNNFNMLPPEWQIQLAWSAAHEKITMAIYDFFMGNSIKN